MLRQFLSLAAAACLCVSAALAATAGNDLGDFDGDGISDLVWRNSTTGDTAIWFMNGGAIKSTTYIQTLPLNWHLEVSGDFDGNGTADLAWQDYTFPGSGKTVMWFMDSTVVNTTPFLSCCSYPNAEKMSAAGDFDGDGYADLVWRNPTGSRTYLMHLRGNQVLSSLDIPAPLSAWTLAGSGDFNGDGKPDLVYRNYTTGDNAVWMMNDLVPIETRFLNSLDPAWKLVAVGDYNGDGWSDLVWRNPTTVRNAIWYMSGTTVSWTEFFCASTADWQIVGPR